MSNTQKIESIPQIQSIRCNTQIATTHTQGRKTSLLNSKAPSACHRRFAIVLTVISLVLTTFAAFSLAGVGFQGVLGITKLPFSSIVISQLVARCTNIALLVLGLSFNAVGFIILADKRRPLAPRSIPEIPEAPRRRVSESRVENVIEPVITQAPTVRPDLIAVTIDVKKDNVESVVASSIVDSLVRPKDEEQIVVPTLIDDKVTENVLTGSNRPSATVPLPVEVVDPATNPQGVVVPNSTSATVPLPVEEVVDPATNPNGAVVLNSTSATVPLPVEEVVVDPATNSHGAVVLDSTSATVPLPDEEVVDPATNPHGAVVLNSTSATIEAVSPAITLQSTVAAATDTRNPKDSLSPSAGPLVLPPSPVIVNSKEENLSPFSAPLVLPPSPATETVSSFPSSIVITPPADLAPKRESPSSTVTTQPSTVKSTTSSPAPAKASHRPASASVSESPSTSPAYKNPYLQRIRDNKAKREQNARSKSAGASPTSVKSNPSTPQKADQQLPDSEKSTPSTPQKADQQLPDSEKSTPSTPQKTVQQLPDDDLPKQITKSATPELKGHYRKIKPVLDELRMIGD